MHPILVQFAAGDELLHPVLTEMLQEHSSHRTERRGCGYTQASRFLADRINQDRQTEPLACLSIFADWPMDRTAILHQQLIKAGWSPGWRELHNAPFEVTQTIDDQVLLQRLLALMRLLDHVAAELSLEEHQVLLGLIRDMLTEPRHQVPQLVGMREKPNIGSCSQAEEFFLEIAHGKIRRGGRVNIYVDQQRQPVLIEKIGLGESHSALVIAPVQINNVVLPPGSLCALQPDPEPTCLATGRRGSVFGLDAIVQTRFLRLTTLSAPPKTRHRAFSSQMDAQVRARMLSPATTTLQDMRAFADRTIKDCV